ncbi:hypothetical protein JTB14_036904 [Gonioctena quinquepunctata]|nr:hypothetical protein JTB14_036904 [Gonioctena quinquepunctata]
MDIADKEDRDSVMVVNVTESKTGVSKNFTVVDEKEFSTLPSSRHYMSLRPEDALLKLKDCLWITKGILKYEEEAEIPEPESHSAPSTPIIIPTKPSEAGENTLSDREQDKLKATSTTDIPTPTLSGKKPIKPSETYVGTYKNEIKKRSRSSSQNIDKIMLVLA